MFIIHNLDLEVHYMVYGVHLSGLRTQDFMLLSNFFNTQPNKIYETRLHNLTQL